MSRHVKNFDELGLSADQCKARRMKRALQTTLIIAAVLLLCLGFLFLRLYQESNNVIKQQTLLNQEEQQDNQENQEQKSSEVEKVITAPSLAAFIGESKQEVMERLSFHGATITGTYQVSEGSNPLKEWVHVALTNEPGDVKSGTPTVYLGLNAKGVVQAAGYSAPLSLLGYASISFADAVNNERVIEKTFAEAGLTISKKDVKLPQDKIDYSEYATDGTTLVKENCTFEGVVEQAGKNYHWSATLMYDYALANSTGNLADTIRRIYIEVSAA